MSSHRDPTDHRGGRQPLGPRTHSAQVRTEVSLRMEMDTRTALAAGNSRRTGRPTANVTRAGEKNGLGACHHKAMHQILKTYRTTDLHHSFVHKMHNHWHRAAQLQAARRQVEKPMVPKPSLLQFRNGHIPANRHRTTIVFLFRLETALATGVSRLRLWAGQEMVLLHHRQEWIGS